MKKIKTFLITLLTVISLCAFAIPSGCYEGSSRHNRDRCAIQISDNVLNVINREGDVIAKWNIISDNNGVLSLRSSAGATATATWWKEDGIIYLNFNYETYTRM
ncbi:MAG: hypothetical protein J6X16_04775 [Bacteroidales bacterium]|jgi:uncharacterized ion transporter superfamily protein YfcC|nr:hypothetical protein [Bacteroidales bacterium]